ncbi:MFS transporter [Dissulfurispira sp.]|uniref:MFS transporter n=1 Tax=Dissulfurispira sp. TaxID=2817609 RepID=UPI002FDA53E1
MRKNSWLTRSIIGIGLTSLFSDMGHEMTTAILPMFLATIGGTATTLGLIEGIADASSSFIKLWMGWYSDKIGRRKPIVAAGYVITALKGLFAFTTNWYQVLFIRVLAWMGRGARSPVRDALMVDLLEPANYGRAFGFHTAMNTLGAVIGPAIAFALIRILSYRQIFLISFIPGFLSVACFVFLVGEKRKKSDGKRERLNRISEFLNVHILTADTFGKARAELKGINCEIHILEGENHDIQKEEYVRMLGAERVVALGNGNNDRKMLKAAKIRIAVCLNEGCSVDAMRSADIFVNSPLDALDLSLTRKD